MKRFLEHRIADGRVLRLIQKWLSAGIIENGARTACDEGVPQGASASPLLANVYLHTSLTYGPSNGDAGTRAVT